MFGYVAAAILPVVIHLIKLFEKTGDLYRPRGESGGMGEMESSILQNEVVS